MGFGLTSSAGDRNRGIACGGGSVGMYRGWFIIIIIAIPG
jgi:hypothetical protein